MRAQIHPPPVMTTALRLVIGAVLVGMLGYVWLANATGYVALLAALLLGIGGGLVMGAWWSVLIVPIALFLGVRLSHTFGCADCPVWSEDDTGATLVVLSLMVYGIAALGAAAGSIASRILPARRDR